MQRREPLFGFSGVILGFLLATISLIVAENRDSRSAHVGEIVHATHMAKLLHDGRLAPLTMRLEDEISTGIRLLDNKPLSREDVQALRAVDKVCRTRGITLTAEANAVLVKKGARRE